MIDAPNNAYRTIRGAHGYDNNLPKMRGVFFAVGPSFKERKTIEPFESLHVYSLLTRLLNLNKTEPNDTGSDGALLQQMLKN